MLKKFDETSPQTRLLNVQQAADYLGVHAATVRRWAYAKLLKGRKVGIRGDWRFSESDIQKMAKTNDLSNDSQLSDVFFSPYTDWSTIRDRSHYVQFYENDLFLLESIKKYMETGDAAIVIATAEHRIPLEKAINNDPKKKYIFLDASETLDKFMANGLPDADLFNSVVGGLIREVSKKHKNIRAYGEMVAILWAGGNKTGAISLERLWNNLQKKLSFTLYCAYPMSNIGGSEVSDAFSDVCTTHSDVLPTEGYMTLATNDERLREIAILQQKAQALEVTLKQLKMSEEFNRNIVESSADCIKTLDLQGRLLSMNGPGCKLVEIDDINQIIGMDWVASWKGEAFDAAKKAFDTAKDGGIGRFQGFGTTAKGRPMWMDVMVSPIVDETDTVQRIVAVSRDITELKELEQRKEDFLSATSHELKTPLTSQKAFIQLLQQQVEKNNDKKYVRFVTKIDEQTNKLTKLVTDLLDVSKVQAGKLILDLKSFDLNACIKETIDEVQAISANHKITIKGKLTNDVIADKEKLCQVIVNLLTNAIKYSPNADKIDVTLKSNKKAVLVSVRDYGIGIDKKDQDKIFDRFYRVNDSDEKTYPGLGMGLYIASEIVKQHGGSISAKSTKEKGSTFSFSIPLNKSH